MLRLRLISGTLMLTGLVGLLYLDHRYPWGVPGAWLLPFAVLASLLMVYELLDLWRDRADRPVAWALYIGAPLPVVLAAASWLADTTPGESAHALGTGGGLGWLVTGTVAAIALAFAVEMARYAQPGQSTGRIALSVLAIAYAGLLVGFLVRLRLWHDAPWGMAALVSLIVIVKLSDTGAYFVGRAWGRHPLASVLSPHKTLEGACGGMAAAWLGGIVCQAWIVPRLVTTGAESGPLVGWLVYATVLALAGMFGDLAESLLKRDTGRKDSSAWLPGLGGVLDLLDSLVFAAPVAYACWTCGLIGPR